MKTISCLITGGLLCGVSLWSQQPIAPVQQRSISGSDRRVAPVTPGVVSAALAFIADPAASGGDIFDIAVSDPSIRVSLLRPDSVEISQASASSLGATFTVLADGALTSSTLPVASFSYPGTHAVIALGPGQPSGQYQVKFDATSATSPALAVGVYYSSSIMRAGITTPVTEYSTGDSVVLSGLVFEGASPVTGATVTAHVSTPQRLDSQVTFGSYSLVRQTSIDANTVEYEYRVSLTNNGTAAQAVTATLVNVNPSLQVIVDSIYFGSVAANATVPSGTTFIVQVPAGQTFNPASMQWQTETPATPVSITLVDSGSFDEAAGDGIYSGVFIPTVAGDYLLSVRVTGVSSLGIPFSRSAISTFKVTTPLAQIGSLFETGVSDSGSGAFDRMILTANITVETAGAYYLSETLTASNGKVTEAYARVTLAAGSQPVQLNLPAASVLQLSVDGPYERSLILRYEGSSDHSLADSLLDAGPTAAFTLSSFNNAPLHFTGQNTATGVNTNGLTGFDLLRVQIGIFNPSGSCLWQASLTDPIGNDIDRVSGSGTLTGGANTLTFDFSGPRIARNGQNGPFNVTGVDVFCDVSEITSRSLFATQPFLASQFQNTPADFNLTGATTVSMNTLSQTRVAFSATAIAGFSEVVNLSVAGLPSGVTGTFFWPQLLVPGIAYLQINPGSSVPPGTYPLTISATGGGLTRSVPLSLTVVGTTTTTAANVTATFSPSDQTVILSATVTSGSGTVNVGSVTFTTPVGQETSGSVTGGVATASLTMRGGTTAKWYTLTAVYIPGPGFAFSSDSSHTLTVNKATPAITWSNPADIVAGTALSSAQLNATASVAGTFVYTPVAGTVLGVGNAQALSVLFTPTDTTDYNNASKNVSINVTPSLVPLNQRVLVVYNTNFPDSLTVANYYMTQRGIPAGNLCAISPPSGVELSMTDYINTVKTPVRTCLTNAGNTNILYIVFSYLTPYRILASGPSAFNYALDSYASDIWDKYSTQSFNPSARRTLAALC